MIAAMSTDKNRNDMTQGSIWSQLLAFCIPVIVGDLFQQFYSIADTVIVGRLLGIEALAAVGLTGSLLFLVQGFTQGLCAGTCIVTSQRFGSFQAKIGTEKDVKKSLNTVTLTCFSITVIMMIASEAALPWLLRIMKTPEDVYPLSLLYVRIIFAGLIINTFYNVVACKLRALGDSRIPLIFLIVSSVLNIILDYVFISFFHMGVDGAAYATVLAQLISAVLCIAYSRKYFEILKFRFKDIFDTDIKSCLHHLKIGVSMGIQFSVTSIGVIVEQRFLNTYGTNAIAGFTAGTRVESLITACFFALGTSMATFCGQNIGAKRPDRVKQGVKIAFWIGCVMCAIATTLMLVFGRGIIAIFVGSEATAEVFEFGLMFMRVVGVCFIALHILVIYRNALQGLGYSVIPLIGGILESVSRIVAATFLPKLFGFMGVCMLEPVAWFLTSAVLFITYRLWYSKN